jgi:hypothetical protein
MGRGGYLPISFRGKTKKGREKQEGNVKEKGKKRNGQGEMKGMG